ncbi:MAG: type II secretion system F family protein [Deltaproteobacteria bacterium]|nr:type II secretion system F family protein [Deltaproteobacteria bacterium]MBW2253148.1 type II secretion system F family protein [Deltaproteobacteria bacterium]
MSPLMIGVIFVGAVIIGGIGYSAYAFLNPGRSAADRLEDLTGGPKAERDIVGERIAERLARLAQPESEEEQNILRQKLVQAGYRNRHAPQVFNAVRVSASLLIPLLLAPFAATWSLTYMAFAVIVGAAAGYYGPLVVVNNIIQNRQLRIVRPLPDALDLLVTSVEAGLGLDAAFRRVAEELETAAPDLAFEFQMVNHEISAGFTRIDALRRLQERTGLDEVKSLVNMLTQAERFGTSIARSLRVHSEVTRQKRMSKAEEEAAKISPKLTVVMILFLLPCLMIVLLGPAVVNVMNSSLLK